MNATTELERAFKVGLGVFSIRTAHCIKVFGGSPSGTTGSSPMGISLLSSLLLGDEAGGGSANSIHMSTRLMNVMSEQ
jgi:hypothetical protein